MWEVHYSLEAGNYLADNGELITDLFFALEALANSEGTPTVGDFQAVQSLVYWEVQGHVVVYRRLESRKIVRILVIKPD